MRTIIIFNPTADHGRAADLKPTIMSEASRYGNVDLVDSERTGHAKSLAANAADAGYDLVVAAGGDGTIHEVINGLVHGDRALAKLGIIPIGSGNDYVNGLGLPTDLETAVRVLFTGKPHFLDLARIEDDRGHFELIMNGLGIGFDATISIQSRTITQVHGFAMYLLATLRTIALYYQTPHMELRFDDQRVEQEALLLALGIGPRIGGGFFLTPDAIADDGLLDSCTVNPVSRLTMLQMLPKVMRGTHITSRHVTMRRSRFVDVKSNMPLPIHIDGEIFAYPEDNVRRVTITCLPAALPMMSIAPVDP